MNYLKKIFNKEKSVELKKGDDSTNHLEYPTGSMINEVEKYEFKEEKKEFKLTKRELRGLLFAGTVGLVYVLFFIYNIIPGVPFGGNLLDYKQVLYIDKLFSYNFKA